MIDKWFALQAMIPEPDTLPRVKRLMDHPAFSLANPNRVRALIGAFAAANQTQFNAADGSGYDFIATVVLVLDAEESAGRRTASRRLQKLAGFGGASALICRDSLAARGERRLSFSGREGHRRAIPRLSFCWAVANRRPITFLQGIH